MCAKPISGAAFFLVFLIAVAPYECMADVVYLKTGGKIEGIVISEEGEEVIVRVKSGSMKVRKDTISEIERGAAEDNESLRTKWESEKEEIKRKRQARIEALRPVKTAQESAEEKPQEAEAAPPVVSEPAAAGGPAAVTGTFKWQGITLAVAAKLASMLLAGLAITFILSRICNFVLGMIVGYDIVPMLSFLIVGIGIVTLSLSASREFLFAVVICIPCATFWMIRDLLRR